VLEGYIAQWGLHADPRVTAAWKDVTIPDDPVVRGNTRGTLGFAMRGPDDRQTQLYLNLADNTRNDAEGFATFGLVVEGMDVVDSLYAGYGSDAGGGMRAGLQGPVEEGGNEYLNEHFPLLDYIITARIEGDTTQ
jgi:homoserine O-acetyltransferase